MGTGEDRPRGSEGAGALQVVGGVVFLAAEDGSPLRLERLPRCSPSPLSGCRGEAVHVPGCRHA